MPRNQRTEAQEIPDDLPALTAQQQEFVRLRLEGKTASDAYRGAYDCRNMQANSIWREASLLNSNPNVAQWLAAARKASLGSATVTLDSHLRELERIREIALEKGNIGAAVAAEQNRGKVAGHYVDQVRDLTDRHDPVQTLREIQQHSPELAAALAAQHGIELPAESGTRH